MPTHHNAKQILMGTGQSSDKVITCEDADPATFKAGLAVRRKNDGGLSLTSTDGGFAGVSMGRSLSDSKKTALCRAGNRIPIQLTNRKASGTVTITSFGNLVSSTDDSVTIGGQIFTAQAGAATLGQATFQAATSNDATATSLAAQINAHAVTALLVIATVATNVVTITALAAGEGGEAITMVYTDNDTNIGATLSGATLTGGGDDFVTVGGSVIIDNSTGKAGSTGTTSGATYVEDGFTGIDEDGNSVEVALIDMGGGL